VLTVWVLEWGQRHRRGVVAQAQPIG
jgi:hypothetical protein